MGPESGVLTRVLGELMMYVEPDDISVAPHLVLDGFWEMWLTLLIARHVKPGMVCVDVGANYGYYTLLLSELTEGKSEIFALEPLPRVCRLLERNVRLNGSNAQVLQVAAGWGESRKHLHWSACDLGGATMAVDRIPDSDDYVRTMVSVDSLDSLIVKPSVDFIKIDAEGSELAIWRGMRRLAFADNLTIMMEFDPVLIAGVEGYSAAPEVLLKLIEEDGFVLRSVDANSNVVQVDRETALKPDMGTFRTLWLNKKP